MNRPSSMFTMFWFISTCWILFTWTRVAARSVLRDRQGPDVIKVFVTEGDDVILPCSPRPNVNIEATVFDWRKDNKEVFLFDNSNYFGNGRADQDQDFKGRVFHFDDELKHGNASILLRDTRTTDSGNFTCILPHLGSGQTYRIELVVVLEPHIKILGETKEGVQLQCSVRGASPKPDVHWQNGDEKIVPAEEPQVSEREGRYDIILQTTVTKTDLYRCVSTQEEIHQIYTETYVPVHDAGGMVPVWVVVSAAVVAVFLTLLVWVIVSEFYFVLKKKTLSAVLTNPRKPLPLLNHHSLSPLDPN